MKLLDFLRQNSTESGPKWQEAHESLTLASKYDPEWSLPIERIRNIENFCDQVVTCCKNRGKLSAKRLGKLMEKVKSENDVLCVATLSHFDYLPFCLVALDQKMSPYLVTGLLRHFFVSSSLLVYNMKRGSGPIIGDIVTLPEYVETKNDFSLGDTKYSFITRRIETVQKMKINGRELGAATQE